MRVVTRRLAATGSIGLLVVTGALGGAATATAGPVAPAMSQAVPYLHDVGDPVLSERTVIDVGHVDAISPRLVGTDFRSLLLDDRDPLAPVWRTPESVILHVRPAAALDVADDPDGFAFLGQPGDVLYVIPQTQDPGLIWAGWSTQSFGPEDVRGDLTLTLDRVDGPGQVVLWEWSPFGAPEPVIDGRAGLPASYPVPANTHQHANWAFTRPGVYRLTFTWSADLVDGGRVSDSSVYTFAVGDVDTATVTLPPADQPDPDPSTSAPSTPDPAEPDPAEPTPSGPDPSPSGTTAAPSSSPTALPGTPGGDRPSPTPSRSSAAPSTSAPSTSAPTTSTAATPPPATPAPGTPDPALTDDAPGAVTIGGGSGAPGGSGSLAATGSSPVLPLGVAGGVAIVLGAGVVAVQRRRARRPAAPTATD
ncbi:choice-of-anchor M domain-containing protein [Streptomyces sp. NPDC092296]|uniref:choice-of-anchor M domain-containing protein n=1 Tax=Streptomyces sp. NPDC092296 TaxID=3366012 RepID=UPI0038020EF8